MSFAGLAIARDLAALLGPTASVRELPAYPSRTPEPGAAVLLEVAGRARPLALLTTWSAHTLLPPGLEGGSWRWGQEAFPQGGPRRVPLAPIADGLRRAADAWARVPERLGLLEVVFGLLDTPGPPWGATITGQEASIGLETGPRRWPTLATVAVADGALTVTASLPPPDHSHTLALRTIADLDAAKPGLLEGVVRLVNWCAQFVETRRALERFADVVAVELGKVCLPPRGGHWHALVREVDDFGTRDVATARLAPVGVTLRAGDDGGVVVDGTSYPEDTPLPTLLEAIDARARASFALFEGACYRLTRPLDGFSPGALLVFLHAQDMRPSDRLLYTFRAKDGTRRLTLSEEDPTQAAIIDTLSEHLVWVDDEVNHEAARARRVASLVEVARHLREHGALEAAHARVTEALSLKPRHPEALEEARLIAAAAPKVS